VAECVLTYPAEGEWLGKANPTVDPDAMKAGQKLNIPSKTTVVGAENVEPASSR
jgi:hypothetical protein